MKKAIYAVKIGRETGIFDTWQKCFEQTNKYSNASYKRFVYQSSLENGSEDEPGSLRYAFKEAEKFLEGLVYLGESGDYMQDSGWKEKGFLPFWKPPSGDIWALLDGDERDIAELPFDIDGEYAKESSEGEAGQEEWQTEELEELEAEMDYFYEPSAQKLMFYKMAGRMETYFKKMRYSESELQKRRYALMLNHDLEKCCEYRVLRWETQIYRDKKENNILGYEYDAVEEFIREMKAKCEYPDIGNASMEARESEDWRTYEELEAYEGRKADIICNDNAAMALNHTRSAERLSRLIGEAGKNTTGAKELLKYQLELYLEDKSLDSLTKIYKDSPTAGGYGYEADKVSEFMDCMGWRYLGENADSPSKLGNEREIFLCAEAVEIDLKQKIFGQDAAIEKLRKSYFNAEMKAMKEPNRKGPKNAYFLAGPPGVGKTFMAETFADLLGMPFKRFDMSCYSNSGSIEELIGFASTYKDSLPGPLTQFVAVNPACVLLFDEIEKADMDVIRLFLQILDRGSCQDKFEKRDISFQDTILFFTTNAGKQLYQNAENENLALLPDQVIMDALKKDKDITTGKNFFPPELLSRVSSYTVIMLNHLRAAELLKLVNEGIDSIFSDKKKEWDCDWSYGKEYLARTMLYSIGGSIDARNASKLPEKLINEEWGKLLENLEEERQTGEDSRVKCIEWKCDFQGTGEAIRELYFGERKRVIPIFGDVQCKSVASLEDNEIIVKSTTDPREFMEIIHRKNILFAVVDYIYGLENEEHVRNLVNAETVGKEVFRTLREENWEIPVYVLDGSCGRFYGNKEKNILTGKGAKGFLGEGDFESELEQAYLDVCCTEAMETLAMRHQVLTYETRQEFNAETDTASIVFCEFRLETAVESEDRSTVLSINLRPNKSWDDICVSDDTKKKFQEIIDNLRAPKAYNRRGVGERGVLLEGPPGTGKTLLAKVVASESNMTFLSISAGDLANGGSAMVREKFRIARKYAPAILFIDEIDAISMDRRYSTGPNLVLNGLLVEMDGFQRADDKPVFIMAATNLADRLDPAILRRFELRITMDYLEKDGNMKLLKMLIDKQSDLFELSERQIASIAERAEGLSPAIIEQVVKAAIREGIRYGCKIKDNRFDELFEQCTLGAERTDRSPETVRRIAYHEAGHALLGLYYNCPPQYMSVAARGNYGGYVLKGKKTGVRSKKDFLNDICMTLGGRAAEMVLASRQHSGEGITLGASSDLKEATDIAAAMVCSYGMYEDEMGLAIIEGRDIKNDQEVRKLVNQILSEQLKEAIRIIEANWTAMTNLVNAVKDQKKYLLGEEIRTAAGSLNRV